MHEFATAQSLVKTIKELILQYQLKKVYQVNLKIGFLTMLNPEQLTFWLKEGLKGTIGENAEVNIKEESPIIVCKVCSYEGELLKSDLADFFFFFCPNCKSTEISFKAGIDYCLESLEAD